MLYYEEPYLKRIKAKIIENKDGKVLLDRTILYEGGGGQVEDVGYAVCNGERKRIIHLGNNWHSFDGDCDDEIEIELDWKRRYMMMRMHTAEHAFFRFLQNKGAELIKISLGDESSIFFRGDINIEDILDAEKRVRDMIKNGREVKTFWISKKDVKKYPQLRIKADRIKGDRIRVVEIEGHDISACKGIHVKNMREISDFAATKFRSGKKKEVKFIIGEEAKEFHREMSSRFRAIAWKNGVEYEKLGKFVDNLKDERYKMLQSMKLLSEELPFHEDICGDTKILWRIFYGGDRKTIVRRMMKEVNDKNKVAIYGDEISSTVGCAFSKNLERIRDLALKILADMNGKGGGGENFISGFVPDPEKFIKVLKEEICKNI